MHQKFTYLLRISEKAKHVRFQVSAEEGLVIVVPKRFSASRLPSLVEENSRWIERALQRAKVSRGFFPQLSAWQIPKQITFPALGQNWAVLTNQESMKQVVVKETAATTLTLRGAIDDALACQNALKVWLTGKGKDHLVPWLNRMSEENALPYSSVSIRQQRSRWGSCSSRHLISLNARLLFLAPELVTYVMVHELCHTVHLDHSPRFWRLVAYRLPNCRQLDRQLRNGGHWMPGWLLASCGSGNKA